MKKNYFLTSLTSIISILLMLNVGLIMAESSGGGTDPSCDSGGPGAVMCTVTYSAGGGGGGVNGTGSASCTVQCGDGYYACCTLRIMSPFVQCRCKSNGGQSD